MKKYTFSQLPESIRNGIFQPINDLSGFDMSPSLRNHINKLKERAEKSTYMYAPNFPVNLLEFISATPDDFLRKGDKSGYDTLMHYVNELKSGKTILPAVIRKRGDRYNVIDGHHRLDAILYLRRKTVPALIEWW